MGKNTSRDARVSRHARVRKKVEGCTERPRMCVFRSLNNIYVQVIDDSCGRTLAAASTLDPELKGTLDGKNKVAIAESVGVLIGQRSLAKGINTVVYDRGGYKYHGRVKALADGARQAGLKF